jgi:sugar lactone lactonase YvrE
MHALTKLGALATSLGLLAACSGSDPGTTTGTGGTSSSSSASSASATTGTGGTGGATPAVPTFVAHLDPAKGELPEGLFVVGNKAYVGLAALGKIVTVDLTSGTVADFGSIPAPPMNGGFMLGIVADAAGNVYVGFGGGPGMVVKNGVYKIPAAGGAVTAPWAADPAMNFPNGLILDDKGNVVVADSGGTIFKIAPDATVTTWLADPSLSAAGATCSFMAPFPIGANGIALSKGVYYVSNTNLAQIVSIPVKADGTAGTPALLAGPDCDGLGGIDGIALDGAGDIYAVLNSQNKLVHLAAGTSKIDAVFTGTPLDNPASISVGAVGGKASLLITNSAFFDTATPAPGLLGYPLP